MPKFKAKIYRHTEYEITFESSNLEQAKEDARSLMKDTNFDDEEYANEDVFIKEVTEE